LNFFIHARYCNVLYNWIVKADSEIILLNMILK
jgi:hypothetical protein